MTAERIRYRRKEIQIKIIIQEQIVGPIDEDQECPRRRSDLARVVPYQDDLDAAQDQAEAIMALRIW